MFFSYIKILKDSWPRYYQKSKERDWKKAPKRYQDFSEEEKKRRNTFANNIKNLPEDEKRRFVEYRKKYYKTWKNKTASQGRTG